MDIKTYNSLLKLLYEYYSYEHVTGKEFIEAKLSVCSLTDDEIRNFALLIEHKDFLDAVKNNFVAYNRLRNYSEVKIVVFLFFVLFLLNEQNSDEALKILKDIKCAFKIRILRYFTEEHNLMVTALAGCKIFEDQYVLTTIVHPLLNKMGVLKKCEDHLLEEKVNKYVKKPLTVPMQLKVLQRKGKVPMVPLNTPVTYPRFRRKKIPKSVYIESAMEEVLAKEYEINRKKAMELLEKAKTLSTKFSKKIKVDEKVPEETGFKARRVPPKTDVQIKGTIATVLREAKLCIKEQEKEIEEIEKAMKGGAVLDKYRELEEETRQLERRKFVEDIERKHLEGLLTFEEAILAKQRLLDFNKERFKRFQEERDDYLREIESWREREQDKIKQLVRKSQEIERGAKESEKKLRESKQLQASQVKDEKAELLRRLTDQKHEELQRKARLIEEIKSLHQVRMLQNAKEFDPTDVPDVGLLCAMSIAELQQRLAAAKAATERQLELKRRCIEERRRRRKEMIDEVKNFVAQTRMSKPKPVPIRPTELEPRSPDLVRLREKVERVRESRKNARHPSAQATTNTPAYLKQFI